LETLDILYEDNHLIAINKAPGTLVQGDKTGDIPLNEQLKSFIKNRDQKPGNVYLGVPHRLDRPTSGIVIFAKTSKVLPRMNALFAQKDARKIYWAIVQKNSLAASGTLVHWLRRNPKQNKSYAHLKEVPESKLSSLEFKILKELDRYNLLEINLLTGRHHQIRAQLAAVNCHIKGDLKYGADRSNSNGSIHLHARRLSFIHPVKKTHIDIVAPPPRDCALWRAAANGAKIM
jgi:23S rRNA pseudouridine1911/1915/1917 synthase